MSDLDTQPAGGFSPGGSESRSSEESCSPRLPDEPCPSTIEDSQGRISAEHSSRFLHNVLPGIEDISEATLSQGFQFQQKMPIRPGQFSERPVNKEHAPKTPLRTSESARNSTPTPKASQIGGFPVLNKTTAVRRPLHLPELPPPSGQADSGRPTKPAGQLHDTRPAFIGNAQKTSVAIADTSSQDAIIALEAFSSSSPNPKEAPVAVSKPKLQNRTTEEEGKAVDKPLGQLPKIARSHSRKLSGSICGDLEAPGRLMGTPSKHRAADQPFHDAVHSPHFPRYMQISDKHVDQHRPRSGGSNISKKRASVRKYRSHRDPERKKKVMHHVAQYWNECLQIAEEEKEEAAHEIRRLQYNLQQQSQLLNQVNLSLHEKNKLIDGIQDCVKDLGRNPGSGKESSEPLDNQIKLLVNEVRESSKRTEALKARSKNYRTKLNETISEQQSLYLHSRNLCQQTMEDLKKERAKNESESVRVSEALKVGQAKREEMHRTFELYRNQVHQEATQKDHIISELNAKMAEKDEHQEQMTKLANQLEGHSRMHEATDNMIQQIGQTVQCLLDSQAKKDEENEQSANMMVEVSSRINSLIAKMETNAQVCPQLADTEALMEKVQEKVIERIVPDIQMMATRQNHTEKTITGLGSELAEHLQEIVTGIGALKEHSKEQQDITDERHGEIAESLHRFDAALNNKTQEFSQLALCHFDTWADAHANKMADLSNQDALVQQLQERDATIAALERRIQLTVDEYAAKVNSMREGIIWNNRTAKMMIHDVATQLKDQLAKTFEGENERSYEKAQKAEIAAVALQTELKQVKKKLESAVEENGRLQGELTATRASSKDTSNTILTQKLTCHEEAAKTQGELGQRWREDIDAIGRLRRELATIGKRIPEVEGMGAKLVQIAEMNQLIHATTGYLANEREWVQEQLRLRGSREPSNTADEKPVQELITVAQYSDKGAVHIREAAVQSLSAVELQPVSALSQTVFGQRRVLVQSPAGSAASPSPPPSVQQEQLRRRQSLRLKSILRPPERSRENYGIGVPSNHSQYNRPVVSEASRGQVAKIRSTQVPERLPDPDLSFTSLAEYTRNSQSRSGHEGIRAGKRPSSTQDEPPLGSNKIQRNNQGGAVPYLGREDSQQAAGLAGEGQSLKGASQRPSPQAINNGRS